jgi:hypothetical protein
MQETRDRSRPLREELAASSNLRQDAIAGRTSYQRTEIQKSAMSCIPGAGTAGGVWIGLSGQSKRACRSPRRSQGRLPADPGNAISPRLSTPSGFSRLGASSATTTPTAEFPEHSAADNPPGDALSLAASYREFLLKARRQALQRNRQVADPRSIGSTDRPTSACVVFYPTPVVDAAAEGEGVGFTAAL